MKSYPKMLAPGVAVIGKYNPRKLDSKKIAGHLVKITIDQNLIGFKKGSWPSADWHDGIDAEVRSPENYTKGYAGFPQWHQDMPIDNDPSLGMVLWSNREQTEIKLPDDTILNAVPGDVLLIRNKSVHHRTPKIMSPDRWFFRRFVKVPDWMVA
jgi:hypothetical protein